MRARHPFHELIWRVWRWIAQLWSWWYRQPRLQAKYVEELPEHLDERVIYVVGEGAQRWFVVFLCPCGCGETLYLSLHADGRPRWTLYEHGGGLISLIPSIRRLIGCRSHFFLKRGQIVWCTGIWEETTES